MFRVVVLFGCSVKAGISIVGFSVLPEGVHFLECSGMDLPNNTNLPAANLPKIDEELTFAVLRTRARRKLLVALACGGPQTGADLRYAGRGYGSCKGDKVFTQATLMHLKKMVEAGIVLKLDHATDGRRVLYVISPRVKVTQHGSDYEFNFGFVVARLGADGI